MTFNHSHTLATSIHILPAIYYFPVIYSSTHIARIFEPCTHMHSYFGILKQQDSTYIHYLHVQYNFVNQTLIESEIQSMVVVK